MIQKTSEIENEKVTLKLEKNQIIQILKQERKRISILEKEFVGLETEYEERKIQFEVIESAKNE